MSRFSPDYATARERFRAAVAGRGGELAALPIAAQGPGGELLTIDIGWLGVEQPTRILVHSSGVHGVEGFAGSAIQAEYLETTAPPLGPLGAAIFIHVVNPYGMAWGRRANEHNVDLNRNCLSPDESYSGAPEGYQIVDSLLNPVGPPSMPDLFYLRAAYLVAQHGLPMLKQAVAGGQYINANGLFFGGRALEPGPAEIRRFLSERLTRVERVVSVDVHTGLGRFGRDILLVNDRTAPKASAALGAAFGQPLVRQAPTAGPAYQVRGLFETLFTHSWPRAETFLVGQEFGTYAALRVLSALRRENQAYHFGTERAKQSARLALRQVFVPEDEVWTGRVVARGMVVLGQALALAAQTEDR